MRSVISFRRLIWYSARLNIARESGVATALCLTSIGNIIFYIHVLQKCSISNFQSAAFLCSLFAAYHAAFPSTTLKYDRSISVLLLHDTTAPDAAVEFVEMLLETLSCLRAFYGTLSSDFAHVVQSSGVQPLRNVNCTDPGTMKAASDRHPAGRRPQQLTPVIVSAISFFRGQGDTYQPLNPRVTDIEILERVRIATTNYKFRTW